MQTSADDPELKKEVTVNFTKSRQLEDKIATWSGIKQVVSVMLKCKIILRRRARKDMLDANKPLFGSEVDFHLNLRF